VGSWTTAHSQGPKPAGSMPARRSSMGSITRQVISPAKARRQFLTARRRATDHRDRRQRRNLSHNACGAHRRVVLRVPRRSKTLQVGRRSSPEPKGRLAASVGRRTRSPSCRGFLPVERRHREKASPRQARSPRKLDRFSRHCRVVPKRSRQRTIAPMTSTRRCRAPEPTSCKAGPSPDRSGAPRRLDAP